MEFQQSESIAVRRQWIIVLVDSTDGETGKTGQTGTVKISKNGGTPASSTNSIVEVDSIDMPGHYYIQLTAGELDTLGMISIYYKAAGTLAFHDRGYVTYNDPFTRQGGFAMYGSTETNKGIKKEQANDLLKKIREIIVEEISKIEKAEIPEFPQIQNYDEKLDLILSTIQDIDIDLDPIVELITGIPEPIDYNGHFKSLHDLVEQFGTNHKIDTKSFSNTLDSFQSKLEISTGDISGCINTIEEVKKGFEELSSLMDDFKSTLSDQGDMDKRFDLMRQARNNEKLDQLKEQITKLAVAITKLKYDTKIASLNQAK